eukprot:749003-Hanusia_phi.AAC.2
MIEQVVFKDMIKTDYGRGIGLTGFGIQSNDLLSIGSTFNVYQQEPNAIPSGPSGGSVGPMEHVNSARMPKTSEDETYTTLQILAERWAMQNGFNPDQLTEFGHLMSMRVLAHNCKSLKTTTISGSPAYMAPEQLQGQELTEAVDNWALAVVLWEIMMDKKPWEGRFSDFKYLKAAVVNGEKLHLPADPRPYPPCYLNVIKLGMQYKASDRPSSSFMEGELHNALRMVTSGR